MILWYGGSLMGWIDSIKKLIVPIKKQDPFFGLIRYQKVGFWEGKKNFSPLHREYEITIDGDESRPTESQRQFYREIESRYETLQEAIIHDLLQQLQNWVEEIQINESEVWEHFTLDGFGIPDLDAGKKDWELVYEFKDDGHYFCIMMNGWDIEGIRIDG
jgi:hypothetical protein